MAGFVATTPTTKRKEGTVVAIPVAAGETINQGDIVLVKVGDGYAYKSYYAGAAGNRFAGVAAETVNMLDINPETGVAYASGERTVKVWQKGVFYFSKASAAITDKFQKAYAAVADTKSAQTVTTTSTVKTAFVGVITEIVDSSTVGVRIDVDGSVTS